MAASPTSSRPIELADAVLRIVARHGLDQVSVRNVAAEAGLSIGAVQHHFHTKDEMLVFAFRRVVERTLDRVAHIDRTQGARSALQQTLEQMLPLDQEREDEITVTLAFAAQAAVARDIAAVQAETLAQVRRELGKLLGAARQEAGLPSPADPHQDAVQLLAFVDGLAFHAVSAPGQLPPTTIVASLRSWLDGALSPGPSRSHRT